MRKQEVETLRDVREKLAIINVRSSAGSRTFDECIDDMGRINDLARIALKTLATVLPP